MCVCVHARAQLFFVIMYSPVLNRKGILFFFKCCSKSTETVRTVMDGEPRTSTSTLTQLLNSEFMIWPNSGFYRMCVLLLFTAWQGQSLS